MLPEEEASGAALAATSSTAARLATWALARWVLLAPAVLILADILLSGKVEEAATTAAAVLGTLPVKLGVEVTAAEPGTAGDGCELDDAASAAAVAGKRSRMDKTLGGAAELDGATSLAGTAFVAALLLLLTADGASAECAVAGGVSALVLDDVTADLAEVAASGLEAGAPTAADPCCCCS